jgi:K+-sensing histidine kinase KdpD
LQIIGRSYRRLPEMESGEMTHEIAGPNGNQREPNARTQRSPKLLATTLLNLAIIAVLTLAAAAANGIVPPVAMLVVYFIPVLLATLLWNFEQGMIAAFASALAAEFFLLDPLFSFSVTDRREFLAVLIFLAAALSTVYLADEIRRLRRAGSRFSTATSLPANSTAQRIAAEQSTLHFAGATRTVPERIAELLVGHEPAMYCDQCIQDQLGLKWRQQVQLVTATLAVTNLFRRDTGPCQSCSQLKQVIKHVKPL